MELIRSALNLSNAVEILKIEDSEKLAIIDLGCGGGPDQVFIQNSNFVDWVGVDINSTEIDRLRNEYAELPGINFIDAEIICSNESTNMNDPWNKLSAAAMAKTLKKRNLNHKELIDNNIIEEDVGFSFSKNKIKISGIGNFNEANFVKIDIDSKITLSLVKEILIKKQEAALKNNLIGLMIEVNFYGDASLNCNTFHNIDRLLKTNQYFLEGLTTRTYTSKFMPGNFVYNLAAQTTTGKPFQGDALYMINYDLLKHDEILLKKFIILNLLFNRHDLACEAVINSNLNIKIKNQFLNYVAININSPSADSYEELIKDFSNADPKFFPEIKSINSYKEKQKVSKNRLLWPS